MSCAANVHELLYKAAVEFLVVESINKMCVCYLWLCHVPLCPCRSWSWWRACITSWPVRSTLSWHMMWVATILCSAVTTDFVFAEGFGAHQWSPETIFCLHIQCQLVCRLSFLSSNLKYSFEIFCIYILILLIPSTLQDVKCCAIFLKRSILWNLIYFKSFSFFNILLLIKLKSLICLDTP